ncbi:MAG: type II toxin-antitoxin system ParD family antitoxin [Pseudanabaena sp.]
MQNPPCFQRSLVPALSEIGLSIPKGRELENFKIVVGMLSPYGSLQYLQHSHLTTRYENIIDITITPTKPMPITLQPEQEQFIQTQLATGRYTNATEVIAESLQLLENRNHYDRWVEELRNKIDIAAAECDRGEGINGETAINQLLSRH